MWDKERTYLNEERKLLIYEVRLETSFLGVGDIP
jgi:hypothetical protein